jgi:phage FluMu protein Com
MKALMRCADCGARFQVLDEQGATHVRCPKCNQVQPIASFLEAAERESAAQVANGNGAAADAGEETTVERLARYLPGWGTSVMLHAAVMLICMATAWAVMREPPVIPPLADVILPSRNNVTVSDPATTPSPYESLTEVSSFTMVQTNRPMADLVDNRQRPTELLSAASGSFMVSGMPGWNPRRHRGEPETIFDGGRSGLPAAAKIVYIVDRSGSMSDSFMYVKRELIRAIGGLSGGNEFHVIFYSDGPGIEMPTRRLLPATAANKQLAYDFIGEIYPGGGTDPSEALNRAFRLRPDVIFLLSDGEFAPEIRGQIRTLNRDKRVTVHTICFLYTIGEQTLIEIARDNGGTYKYIGPQWLKENIR